VNTLKLHRPTRTIGGDSGYASTNGDGDARLSAELAAPQPSSFVDEVLIECDRTLHAKQVERRCVQPARIIHVNGHTPAGCMPSTRDHTTIATQLHKVDANANEISLNAGHVDAVADGRNGNSCIVAEPCIAVQTNTRLATAVAVPTLIKPLMRNTPKITTVAKTSTSRLASGSAAVTNSTSSLSSVRNVRPTKVPDAIDTTIITSTVNS
jgi:hypothetical protein